MSRKDLQVDAVFDIETEDWDKFVMGGLLHAGGTYQAFDHRNESDFVDAILKVRGIVWGHNAGRYDSLWLLEHLIERDIACGIVAAGSRIVGLQIGDKKDGLTIRDSFAVCPLSLEIASQIGAVRKSSISLDCTCGAACGGYCRIRRRMTRSERGTVSGYLEQDCRATLSFLRALSEFAQANDLDIGATIGSSSYGTAARWQEIKPAKWKPAIYDFCRRGYYGGRVQVFRPIAQEGFRYDINSAYPAALASLSLPVGRPRVVPHGARYLDSHPGFFEAEIEVGRDTFIPPLPVRGEDRLAYPVGRFTGHWTGIELRGALHSGGARIVRVGTSIIFGKRQAILAPFCKRIWALRDSAGPKTALGQWLKWYANSLTGKLAMRPETETIRVIPKGDIMPACKGTGSCTPKRCSGACWRELGKTGRVFSRKTYQIPFCGHVHWAAYLTAWTRVKLAEQLRWGNAYDAVYCDTDSVFSLGRRCRDIGDSLGQWKDEGTFHDFRAIAPKTYAFTGEKDGTDIFRAKAKGIPDAASNWETIFEGRTVKLDRGVDTLRTALRGERIFSRRDMKRFVAIPATIFGDRVLDGEVTRPQTIEELNGQAGK